MPKLIGTIEAGAILDADANHADFLWRRGRLAGAKLGNGIVFLEDTVKQYKKANPPQEGRRARIQGDQLAAEMKQLSRDLDTVKNVRFVDDPETIRITTTSQRKSFDVPLERLRNLLSDETMTPRQREALLRTVMSNPDQYLELVLHDPNLPKLVTQTGAAEIMGISRQAVSKMYKNGQLAGAEVGRVIVFREEIVTAARAAREAHMAAGSTAKQSGATGKAKARRS